MAQQSTKKQKTSNGANLGFEATLWAAADKLRNNMDAAEYKHVVLGLIFLKYISDAFEERRVSLETELGDPKSEWDVAEPQARYLTLEDRDEYQSANVFWVPKVARWSTLQANAKQPAIGKQIDDAMVAIERDNPSLKGVLPKDYARQALDKTRLGELDRPDRNPGVGREGAPVEGHPRARVRVFPLAVCECGGKKGRAVLYTPVRRKDTCRNDRAVQGQGVRPLLRFGRDVCPEREVCRGTGRTDQRYCDLRAGIQPDDLETGEDEPCHPGHREQPRPRACGQFPPRPAPGLKSGFCPCKPAVQFKRLGRRALKEDARWKYGIPLRVTRTLRGCSTLSTTLHRPDRRLRARKRLDVLQPVR